MPDEFKFVWNSTRGFRLRPWDSPYLRWRIETFSGLKADQLTRNLIIRLVWKEKLQLLRFLYWTREIRQYGEIGRC